MPIAAALAGGAALNSFAVMSRSVGTGLRMGAQGAVQGGKLAYGLHRQRQAAYWRARNLAHESGGASARAPAPALPRRAPRSDEL
jgi:hypothetical protein